MKKLLTILAVLVVGIQSLWAEDTGIYDLKAGHKYYIYNTFYERALSQNSDASQPRLVAYSAADDAKFLFEALAAPTEGYVMLRNVASGKYMCASTTNSYSVVLNASSGTGDAYQWIARVGTKGRLISKRNTSARLGVDVEETSAEIGVWYDKSEEADSTTCFQIFESNGKGLDSSRKAWAQAELRNVADYILGEVTNTKYPVLYRNKLTKSAEEVQSWLTETTAITTERMLSRVATMRDSLGTMTSYESNVLLTEDEMDDFGSTFSLALEDVEFNPTYAGDSLYVVLRNKAGRGVRYAVKQDGNYIFIFKNTKVLVYLNKTLTATLDAYYLPKTTAQDTEAEWTIVRKSRLTSSMPAILSTSKAVTDASTTDVDKYGNNTRTVISLSKTQLTLDNPIDFHIMSADAPLTGCTINLAHDKAWLILDNVRPSAAIDNYLSQIQINGRPAVLDQNCRVVIYLAGALIMPYSPSEKVFTGYDGEQYTGDEMSLAVGFHNDLGKNANRFRSFHLKRGYMVTLASGTKGSGYSRVYVADHKDIDIPVLPNALYGRITSVIIKKWSYVSKKGYCSTNGTSSISADAKKLNATWFYTWGADRSSTYDMEYVPIRQHLWWPSMSSITNQSATACLSFNEPEHSEQHDNCDCGGAISEWTSCTHTPDFQQTGMRIGSPAPTADGWLTTYINHCNDMAYRCDFVAIHSYWGSNECADGNAWYSRLKAIYDATKRPIWITEWAYGASWTNESWPSGWNDKLEQNRWRVKDIQKKLEEAPFVERYAYYQWDTQYRNLVDWGDGHVTPAGKVYRDTKSTFAYNADYQFTPVWWAPSAKTPTMTARVNETDETLALTVVNKNGDVTDIMKIQRYNPSTAAWEDYYTETARYKFDADTLRYAFPLADFDMFDSQLRVYIKRTMGDEVYSPIASTGFVANPTIYASSKTEVEGWTCQMSAQNGYTKATGDTYFEVWSPTAAGQQFNYYQDVTDLPAGVYELSAAVFNTSDGVAGDKVNGAVVLYAQADTVQYFTRVTEDSKIDYDHRLKVGGIVVRDGKCRIGIKNMGRMTARWAGGDDFKLIRVGDLDANEHGQYMTARQEAEQKARAELFVTIDETTADASAYIVNPSCERTDTYGWTVVNEGTSTGEAADGVSSNAYWNLWKSSAFTSEMNQSITYLPEGKYSAKALLRGSTNEKFTLTVKALRPTANGNMTMGTASATITPTGNTSAAGSPYKNGWQLCETSYVDIRPGYILNITMRAAASGGSAWWSADDFGLTWQYLEPLPDAISDVVADGVRPTEIAIYDLQGRKVVRPSKGMYIINGKKVIVGK